MKKPYFFIVGAPKCGTTSLCEYLDQHPDIYISKPKEPYFFCPDLKEVEMTLEQYLQLFQVSDKKLCGEGSTWYLYSEIAAQKIKEFNPDAKIIIMLREPISMLYSLHSQRIFSLTEDISDFQAAWEAETYRKSNDLIPKTINKFPMYKYSKIGMFAEQISRYYKFFDKSNIKIILFDDLKRDAACVYKEILDFLEVDVNFVPEFRIYNSNVRITNLAAHKFLMNPPHWLFQTAQLLTPGFLTSFKRKVGWKTIDFLKELFRQQKERPPLEKEFQKYLKSYFSSEIDSLSKLIQRDLSTWKSID